MLGSHPLRSATAGVPGSTLSALGRRQPPHIRIVCASCEALMTAEVDPDLSKRLAGRAPPDIKLPWITYEDADKHDMLGVYARMSLADLAVATSRRLLLSE